MENKRILKVNNLNIIQKKNYVKDLLFTQNLNDALSSILEYEQKDLKLINILLDVINEDLIQKKLMDDLNIKSKCKIKNVIISKIIETLQFQNNDEILELFFKSLTKEELKSIAQYEYSNKTNASNSTVFNKYCFKYKNDFVVNTDFNKTEVLSIDNPKDKTPKSKNIVFKWIVIILGFIVLVFVFLGWKKINEYNGLVMTGIFLDDMNLGKSNYNDLEKIIFKEKKKIENGVITIVSPNGNHEFTYKELGITVNDKDVLEDIKTYNNSLGIIEKLVMIGSKRKHKIFNLKGEFTDTVIDNFMVVLKEKLNTEVRNDGILVNENHEVYYDEGADGFVLNEEKTKQNVLLQIKSLKRKSKVKAEGKVILREVKNKHLSSINKRLSSYTTTFLNAGNRGHNIVLATSRLNGKVLMPNDVFSYLEAVGPYGAANGYLPAPIYLNSEVKTANGGGVCQLTTTLYNAQLIAGLNTVYRTNHTFAPNYVPAGLDATVYSTTVDYKFKNQYEYPIYISAYVDKDKLTVELWSNDKAMNGKTYKPYAYYSNGGYVAYLKVYEEDKLIEQRFLSKSYYKKH